MIFKRLLISAIAFFLSLALGMLCAPVVTDKLRLQSTGGSQFLVAFLFAMIVTLTVHLVTKKIYADLDKMSEVEQQQMQRRWAWLKPAGLALRSPFPLNKNQVIIGRDIKCDVLLLNDSISRKHAEIVREGWSWRIRDLGSSNGTFVNGQHVEDALLNEGDVVTLGDINLTFEGPHDPLPVGMDIDSEAVPFSPDPEAVLDFDPSTQVHRYDGTGTHTEVMTSGTRVC